MLDHHKVHMYACMYVGNTPFERTVPKNEYACSYIHVYVRTMYIYIYLWDLSIELYSVSL